MMATRTSPPLVRRLPPLLLAALTAMAALAGSGAAPAAAQPVKVVALSPLELPRGFPDSAQAQARALFERLLTLKLQNSGVTVVPSSEAGAAWKRLVDSVGGYYDGLTGERVPALYEAVRGGAMREMRAKHGADAWLRPRLVVVDAPIYRGKAQWDGIEDSFNALQGGMGLVPALSFDVSVEDTAGVTLHRGRGGIGVLGKVQNNFFGKGTLRPVAPEQMFADVKRPATAIALALDDFLMPAPAADSTRKGAP